MKSSQTIKTVLILLLVASVGFTAYNAYGYYKLRSSRVAYENVQPVVSEPEPYVNPDPIDSDKIHKLVNDYRKEQGLTPLVRSEALDASAQDKCEDMIEYKYWAHVNPETGVEPWSFIKAHSGDYISAGENLSYGQESSVAVVDSWIDSPTHNENLVKAVYDSVGYGLCDNTRHTGENFSVDYVVQHFIDAP